LAEGQRAGLQQAYRQDQIKVEAAREADMRTRLGLDEKAQQFQQNAWTSQAAMRENALELGQAQLTALTRNNANATGDQSALLDVQQQVADLAAKGDYAGISSLTPSGLKTPEAVNQFHSIVASALQTVGGQQFVAQQNQNVATLLGANALGLQPVKDATGNVDYAATNAAVNAKKAEMAAAAAQNSPEVISEKMRAQSMENIAGVKASTSSANNANTNARNILTTKLKNYQSLVSSGSITEQERTQLAAKAQADYDAAQGGSSDGPSEATPVAPPVNAGTQYINNLFGSPLPSPSPDGR
ncbi:MAG TPA: hypothetical protein VN828_23965, partial [Acidobacteriaceae bacterium]|nr:hypothetical protein [Acidobacteriaceae bacterium]